MSLAPGQQIGDYRILAELGAGGMGKVYKVQNIISDRLEAMKVLLPDLTQDSDLADRFLREIKVQASLEHPNIARLHTAMRADNQLLMLMEFVEGRTVESCFTAERPMPLDHATWYCMLVLSALDYAHARGIVHRDIKPANMMLTPQGQIKLLDFGIARVTNDANLTKTRQTVGSLYYMSPEQINGQPVDARSDLYSLGVSLYQMITGRKPFDGTSDFSIMAAHMHHQAIPPIQLDPSVPQVLNDVILKALAKDVSARYQSASEFHAALEIALRTIQGQPSTAPVHIATPQPTAPPASGGLGLKLGLVGLVTIVLFAGGAYWWRSRTTTPFVPETSATAWVPPPATTTTTRPTAPVEKQADPVANPQAQAPLVVKQTPQVKGPPQPQVQPQSQTPAAPVAVVVKTPEPVAPTPVPAVVTPPRPDPAVVSELRTRRVRIESRLEACKAALASLRQTLAAQGLKPRGDAGIMLQNATGELSEGDIAAKAADFESARQHYEVAEQTLRRLEKLFNL